MVFRRTQTEEQLPETITAGTSLGSLWNWERHKSLYIACALAQGLRAFVSPRVCQIVFGRPKGQI
jgi:hypothetical protein